MADSWEKVEMSETWDEKEEKEIVGVLVDKQEDVGRNHSMMYTIEAEDGERVGVWGATILDSRMKQVPVGAEVKIVFKGREENPKTGREYKVYDVFTKGSEFAKEVEEALEEED